MMSKHRNDQQQTVTACMKIRAVFVAAGVLVWLFAGHQASEAASLSDRTASLGDWKKTRGLSLRVLAERGNTRAQTMLGFAYETGQGVPQNFILAARWYWRAAVRGNPTAQYLLGLAYDKGQGVPLDRITAQKWLILAAARVTGRQRDYYLRIRDAVASKMDANEITEAQFLAYRWTLRRE